jgi:hypothetical protein
MTLLSESLKRGETVSEKKDSTTLTATTKWAKTVSEKKDGTIITKSESGQKHIRKKDGTIITKVGKIISETEI